MKVWVTREEPEDGPLSSALRAAGCEVVLEPVLQRRVLSDAADQLAQLGPDDWLVLTSAYAVEAVAAKPAGIPNVAVVGEPSRSAAEAKGFRVEMVSPGGDAKSLFDQLRSQVTTGKVCYPRSSLVDPPQPWADVEVLSPVLYETLARPFDRGVLDRVDIVSVASPSAVEAVLGAMLEGHNSSRIRFASIGPSTSAAIRKHSLEPWIEAPERSFASLAKALAERASDLPHQPS